MSRGKIQNISEVDRNEWEDILWNLIDWKTFNEISELSKAIILFYLDCPICWYHEFSPKEIKEANLHIHLLLKEGYFDPRGRPTDHYFGTRFLSVPTFQNISKQNNFQVRIVITTSGTVDLAKWIIVSFLLKFNQTYKHILSKVKQNSDLDKTYAKKC